RVLIHSAAGGVGLAAVQIAARAGASVTGLIGSESKAAVIREHGARDHVTREAWEAMSDADAPRFDTILDPSGGSSVKRSIARLLPGGRVICYGVGSIVEGDRRNLFKVAKGFLSTPLFTPFKFMMSNTGLYGLNLLKLIEAREPGKPSLLDRAFDDCVKGAAERKLKPVVGKTFALEEVGEAHRYLQSRASIGKVVLIP
ncbi:MAG TPA: zinc-binding dehydrogenase, partial [Bdellovibrionota bacterium]|nr:zinc-binding dehydrogenase [Bdellovibrionota bacterium]